MDVKGNFPVAKGHLERFSSYLFRRKLGRKHNQNIVQNQNRLQKKINLSSVQDSNVAKVAAFSWTRRSFDDFVNNKCALRIFTVALLDSNLCKVKNYISKKKMQEQMVKIKDTLQPEGLSVSTSLWWWRLVLLWIKAVAASTIARVER